MSLEESKFLLQANRIVPNKLLGQNFMVDSSLYPKLSSTATLNVKDVVLDAGAGFGFLTRFLASKCKQVIAVEKDPNVADVLREQIKDVRNVTFIEGDVLKVDLPSFNKAVSIPPYYLSSQLLTWLLDRRLDSAVLIVQKEFAERLVASVKTEDYGWLAVVAQQAAEVDVLDEVPKWMFHPQPEIDSVIIRLKPWATTPFNVEDKAFFRRMVKWLFTQRNKKLDNAITPFIRSELKLDKPKAQEVSSRLPFRDRRARELAPKDFGAIADALSK
jgi:16S rRNA (adenine1518-N6/adenine1519-N6)-dimethyltransferase